MKRWQIIALAVILALGLGYIVLHPRQLGLTGPHAIGADDNRDREPTGPTLHPAKIEWQKVDRANDGFRVIAEDPNNGIIETQAVGGFSLQDADCGDVRGIATKYRAEPDPGSSAVYNFEVKPQGDEATSVGLQAVFTSQVQIPLRLMSSENCVSTGVQEARLLKQIELQSHQEHRPQYKPPTG